MIPVHASAPTSRFGMRRVRQSQSAAAPRSVANTDVARSVAGPFTLAKMGMLDSREAKNE
jgi:hypothetical protein